MRVLIIGGTRRCGPYLVEELLDKGHEVICYHRGQSNVAFSTRAKQVLGDRKNREAFEKQMGELDVEAVVDMIAVSDADVATVAQVFRKKIRRYICISSYDVYEAYEAAWNHRPSLQPVPIPENAPKKKQLHFYESDYEKVLVEEKVQGAQNEGYFSTTILRWPAIYGPRDPTPRDWYYVRQALDGRKQIAVPDGGSALLSRGYMQNMAHSIVLALENTRADGEVYNVCDEMTYSLRQIVQMIGEIMGHEWEIVSVPRALMPKTPRTQSRPFSYDPYDIEPHLLLDISKIKADLGYRDTVPTRKALEATVGWLRDNPLQKSEPVTMDYVLLDQAIERSKAFIRETS
jgi:nucleoside-diphosphate-sugar epimerase